MDGHPVELGYGRLYIASQPDQLAVKVRPRGVAEGEFRTQSRRKRLYKVLIIIEAISHIFAMIHSFRVTYSTAITQQEMTVITHVNRVIISPSNF